MDVSLRSCFSPSSPVVSVTCAGVVVLGHPDVVYSIDPMSAETFGLELSSRNLLGVDHGRK